MPTDWRTGLIFPVHKKGSEDKCENYRRFTHISQIYKIFASVQQNRVVRFAEMIVEDNRNGFTSGQGMTDNILVLKQIIEKHMNVTYIYMSYL